MKHSERFRNVKLKTRESVNLGGGSGFKRYDLSFIYNSPNQGDIYGVIIGHTDSQDIRFSIAPQEYWDDARVNIKEHFVPVTQFSIRTITEKIEK